MHLWDRLLPQAEMTVNLLPQATAVPTISAHAYLNVPQHFIRMPLEPLGCAVQVHENPAKRKSWDPHAVNGWYIGTLAEHS